MVPEERGVEYTMTKPEWLLDLEVIFSLTFDRKFLDVEKEYMSGSTDYVDGDIRLWAAEPFARGKALCSDTITGCKQGIPANAPMYLPGVFISVDRAQTKKMLEGSKPENWPEADDDEALEKLYKNLESQEIPMAAALSGVTSASDGRIAILPQRALTIQVLWTVSPIYLEHKWDGSVTLDRWVSSVSSMDVSYHPADHTMKSKCSVRLVFEIDHSSVRFLETPNLSLSAFLALIGAYAGYAGIFASFLALWQKFVRPFGLINIFDIDDAVLAKHEAWSAKIANKITSPVSLSPFKKEPAEEPKGGSGGNKIAPEGEEEPSAPAVMIVQQPQLPTIVQQPVQQPGTMVVTQNPEPITVQVVSPPSITQEEDVVRESA
ncbi:unnamed protein product [Amoebophrya sp. A25]|nr:unnamed protein product [Amoebophrya sp. A25]|eukprot:GSA25T00023255001.1